MDFEVFFEKATDLTPFPHQRAFAEAASLPRALVAPTGAGKTATVVLGWLWRRLHGPEHIRGTTPTRLVYCLPMRVLVSQTVGNSRKWLERLGLGDRVAVHALMGGEDPGDWDLRPESPAILVGTQDMLLSRGLNRGYGMSRYRWPMHFGLLNNDCLWVFDEVQLMGTGLATSAQMEAFRETFGSAAHCASIWMSATFRREWLETVDFKDRVEGVHPMDLSREDREMRPLAARLTAGKRLEPVGSRVTAGKGPYDPRLLADCILEAHEPGTRTLIVVNTVNRALDLFAAIEKRGSGSKSGASPELLLLHSRFRPREREERITRLLEPPPEPGRIAVTTQVVEAGVDVSAKTLFTELAPWASLVQRFGRCNRYGEFPEAAVLWIDLPLTEGKSKGYEAPYSAEELAAARARLAAIGDVSPASIKAHLDTLGDDAVRRLFPYSPQHVIRRKDLVELFDTTPDLAGSDIDIGPFIRDGEDLDAQVFWREFDGNEPGNEPAPGREELCSVPIGDLRRFLKNKTAFEWDHLDGEWRSVDAGRVHAGRTYLIAADQGGYDPRLGWSPKSRRPVPPVVEATEEPDANDRDMLAGSRSWESIAEHTDKVVEELERILSRMGSPLPPRLIDALRNAARWHDRGKAHEVFRNALPLDDGHEGRLWAKAPSLGRYSRKGFRHELASALAMLRQGLDDLACYLAAAHHGKVRLSIRSLPTEDPAAYGERRIARGIADRDVLPETDLGGGVTAEGITLSLEPMELGLGPDGDPSWAERMLRLRDDPEIGPFRLAFLEALLRAADMRASASGAGAVS